MDVKIHLDGIEIQARNQHGDPLIALVKFKVSAADGGPILEMEYRVPASAGLDAAVTEAQKLLEAFALCLAGAAKVPIMSGQASPSTGAG
jgi:hypothetical protein